MAHSLRTRWGAHHATFDVVDGGGRVWLPGCAPDVALRDTDGVTIIQGPGARRGQWTVSVGDARLCLELSVERRGEALCFTLTATNDGERAVTLDSLTPLASRATWQPQPVTGVLADLSGWYVWMHGQRMTSDALTHRFGRNEFHPTFLNQFVERERWGAVWHADGPAIFAHDGTQQALALGFVTLARQFGRVEWGTDEGEHVLHWLAGRCLLEGYRLPPGASVTSETLLVAAGAEPVALIDRYAREAARRIASRAGGAARSAVSSPTSLRTGWCSWYYFYNQVSEADVLANLDALTSGPFRVDYAQIDDGFQSATGDWLIPNERFPNGMRPVAAAIAAAGLRPGLWLAPFTVNTGSRLYAEHPEWMLHDTAGQPIIQQIWLGPCAGLDCSHPGAQAWLTNVIRTVVHELGFTMLKLDALFTACYPNAVHHAPNTTTAANLRLGLEIVREAAGEEAFILGCSCPFGPALGLVNAMRTGPDVEARWFNHEQPWQPSTKHAMRMTLQRNWMHRRWWQNDPDCLTVRDNEAAIVPGALTLEEARFLATGVALSGGLAVLSDDQATLSPERLAVALRALPPTDRAARPLDLAQRETPALWTLPLGRGRHAVVALNWGDTPDTFSVSWQQLGIAGRYHAREQWTDTPLGVVEDALRFTAVPPHGARVVVLDPNRPPRRTRRLLPVS